MLKIVNHLHKLPSITFRLHHSKHQPSGHINRTYAREVHLEYNRGFNGDFEADDLWGGFIGDAFMRTNKRMKTIGEFYDAWFSIVYNKYKSKNPSNVETAKSLRLVSKDFAAAYDPYYIHLNIGGDFMKSVQWDGIVLNSQLSHQYLLPSAMLLIAHQFLDYYSECHPDIIYWLETSVNSNTTPIAIALDDHRVYFIMYPQLVFDYDFVIGLIKKYWDGFSRETYIGPRFETIEMISNRILGFYRRLLRLNYDDYNDDEDNDDEDNDDENND